MSKLPFMKFYPKDFIADTVILTNEEVGAYMRLLCLIWGKTESGCLNIHIDSLSTLFGTQEPLTQTLLRSYKANNVLDIAPGKESGWLLITSRRMARDKYELSKNAHYQSNFRKKSSGMSKGASKGKIRGKKAEGRRQIKNPISLTEFDVFWEMYPKKESKQSALKSWTRINPDEELTQKIMGALANHRRSQGWQKDDGQYIPLPVTWLNQSRWLDELKSQRMSLPDPNLENKMRIRDAEIKRASETLYQKRQAAKGLPPKPTELPIDLPKVVNALKNALSNKGV